MTTVNVKIYSLELGACLWLYGIPGIGHASFPVLDDCDSWSVHKGSENSTSDKFLAQECLRLCPTTPFSWTFDSKEEAVVSRNCFSFSEGIFISVTGSVLTRLNRKIAAVVS